MTMPINSFICPSLNFRYIPVEFFTPTNYTSHQRNIFLPLSARDQLLLVLFPVWPDVGIKSDQNFQIGSCQKSKQNSFFSKCGIFQNTHKSCTNIWASFIRTIVAKNFQKSPNLVTLVVTTIFVLEAFCRCTNVYQYYMLQLFSLFR